MSVHGTPTLPPLGADKALAEAPFIVREAEDPEHSAAGGKRNIVDFFDFLDAQERLLIAYRAYSEWLLAPGPLGPLPPILQKLKKMLG